MRFLLTSLTCVGSFAALLAGCSSSGSDPSGDATSGAGGSIGSGSGGTSGAGTGTGGTGTGAGGTGTGGIGTGTGGTGAGGTGTGGIGTGTGGTSGGSAGSNAGGTSGDVDANGKGNAKPGDMTSLPQDYLRLGEIRLLNNNWGSEDLGCNTPMSVFVNQDGSFGWSFDRGDCDLAGAGTNPDFPQAEFGIHPFGIGDELVTSPEFSSTTLLPLQIKNITSASVTVENLSIVFESAETGEFQDSCRFA